MDQELRNFRKACLIGHYFAGCKVSAAEKTNVTTKTLRK